MIKRTIEVFTAGCPACDEAVNLIQGIICPSCELRILDMRADASAQAKAKQYSVTRVPAVAVGGKLADCCGQNPVDADALKALGVGTP